MNRYKVAFVHMGADKSTRVDYTVRICDDILTFNNGVAETTNAALARYIRDNMDRQFVVTSVDDDPVLASVMVDDEVAVGKAVEAESIPPLRKPRKSPAKRKRR